MNLEKNKDKFWKRGLRILKVWDEDFVKVFKKFRENYDFFSNILDKISDNLTKYCVLEHLK